MALSPGHAKALYRLASAAVQRKRYVQAVAACRDGQRAEAAAGDRSGSFQQLLNTVCGRAPRRRRRRPSRTRVQVSTAAALDGSLAAFDGRTLTVRHAGEDAWLCRIAPADPALDGELDEDGSLLAGDQLDLWAGTAALGGAAPGALQVAHAEAHARLAARRAAAASRPASFRCLQDALAAAADGDRIVLQAGHHNLAGTSARVDKRVLICGEGALGDTYVEQRSNAPLLLITAPAVVRNLSLDLCGFRECVMVAGDARVTPLLEQLKLRSSGSNALVTCDACAPTLRAADLGAAKVGVLALHRSRPQLLRCLLSQCGEQALRAQDATHVTLEACRLVKNEAEAAVAMDAASVTLIRCQLSANKGPALDVSDRARAFVHGGEAADNAGGVFLWGAAEVRLEDVCLGGGLHHALLAGDDGTRCTALGCTIVGDVMETSAGSLQLEHAAPHTNIRKKGKAAAMLPPEEGCFKFEADRYLRKQ